MLVPVVVVMMVACDSWLQRQLLKGASRVRSISPPFTVMTANTLASECLHLASRLRQGSSQPSGTCWDEATEEATEHVARYAAWVRAAKGVKGTKASKESSAAKGMEKASRTLKEAWRVGEIWSCGKVRWILLKLESEHRKEVSYIL